MPASTGTGEQPVFRSRTRFRPMRAPSTGPQRGRKGRRTSVWDANWITPARAWRSGSPASRASGLRVRPLRACAAPRRARSRATAARLPSEGQEEVDCSRESVHRIEGAVVQRRLWARGRGCRSCWVKVIEPRIGVQASRLVGEELAAPRGLQRCGASGSRSRRDATAPRVTAGRGVQDIRVDGAGRVLASGSTEGARVTSRRRSPAGRPWPWRTMGRWPMERTCGGPASGWAVRRTAGSGHVLHDRQPRQPGRLRAHAGPGLPDVAVFYGLWSGSGSPAGHPVET